MALWLLAYPVLILILLAVAIYEHINTTTLSLPVSPAITILTILLPVFATINAFYYPQLSRPTNTTNNTDTRSTWRALLAPTFQLLQFALTTVLGTLLSSNLVPTDARACLLSTRWMRMWRAHDAEAIRRIQDAFNCCGLNSVKDRAWPFPRGGAPAVDCAAQWGRTTPCVGPWTAALRQSSGADFAVVAGVGLLQLVSLLVSRWLRSRRASLWSVAFKSSNSAERGRTRPLLEGNDANRHDDDEEHLSYGGSTGDGREPGRRPGGANGYGSTGPRVEPIRHDPWADDGSSV